MRPLDEVGNPVLTTQVEEGSRRGAFVAGGVVLLLVVLAVGGVVLWRNLIGSAYGSVETVPADADMVFSMDFLQIRDTERVERFVLAFAEPMAEHGIIEEALDLESALREFDDEAEEEIGFRFAEDVFSWIGRSGSIAIWFPDGMFDIGAYDPEVVPSFLAVLQVRNEQAAQSFLDRVLAEAEAEGEEIERIQVGGAPAYVIPDDDLDTYLALHEGRFLLADSISVLRRAMETEPDQSIAQTQDFQTLTAALGGEPLMTMYMSSSLGEQVADVYTELGIESPYADALASTSAVATVDLDDDGVVFRMANAALPDLPIGAGEWGPVLPADTYGFFDFALPENYIQDMTTLYQDTMEQAGVPRADIDELTSAADEVIGMSLVDDLLPQFGGEVLWAAAPASDGDFVEQIGFDLGMLFGIGLDDAGVVERALDNLFAEMPTQGLDVVDRGGVRVVSADGADFAAVTVTNDALAASTSVDLLTSFAERAGSLSSADTYQRIDSAVAGDGLAMYVDIAAVVNDFVTDESIRDVLAPLIGAGAAYALEGDLQISEVRILVDY